MRHDRRAFSLIWGGGAILLICGFCALLVYTKRAESPRGAPSEHPASRPEAPADTNGPAETAEAAAPLDEQDLSFVDGVPAERDMKMLYGILPSEGDVPALLDVIYESWEVDLPFADPNRFPAGIERIPVQAGSATKEQLKGLQDTLARVTWVLGTNDVGAYLTLLRESGETVTPQAHKVVYEALRGEYKLRENEIPADDWELMAKYVETAEYNSAWRGLITKHSQIKVFEARTGQLPQPYQALQDIRRAVTVFRHVTQSPVPLADMVQKEGSVQVADVLLYVAHDDNKGGIVRPYALRFWLDPTHKVWRPLSLRAFQNPNEHFDVTILF
jgi:hypothetical protein